MDGCTYIGTLPEQNIVIFQSEGCSNSANRKLEISWLTLSRKRHNLSVRLLAELMQVVTMIAPLKFAGFDIFFPLTSSKLRRSFVAFWSWKSSIVPTAHKASPTSSSDTWLSDKVDPVLGFAFLDFSQASEQGRIWWKDGGRCMRGLGLGRFLWGSRKNNNGFLRIIFLRRWMHLQFFEKLFSFSFRTVPPSLWGGRR